MGESRSGPHRERRTLRVGDRIWVGGGYDYEPKWMTAAADPGYRGTVVEFIPGQNEQPASLIELDEEIVLPEGAGAVQDREVRGLYLVLELGHVGTDWATPRPRIHVELCDFRPEPERWEERRHGEWVESHATYDYLEPGS
jgi:hypothetical protein